MDLSWQEFLMINEQLIKRGYIAGTKFWKAVSTREDDHLIFMRCSDAAMNIQLFMRKLNSQAFNLHAKHAWKMQHA